MKTWNKDSDGHLASTGEDKTPGEEGDSTFIRNKEKHSTSIRDLLNILGPGT